MIDLIVNLTAIIVMGGLLYVAYDAVTHKSYKHYIKSLSKNITI